jgi:hypothetical protein
MSIAFKLWVVLPETGTPFSLQTGDQVSSDDGQPVHTQCFFPYMMF